MKLQSAVFVAFSFLTLPVAQAAPAPFGIVIHGGAGTISRDSMTPVQQQAYETTLKHAVDTGYQVLANGGSSLDAVSAAVVILEDSPLFNAGKGAVYTYDGKHELDAAIMRGDNRAAGAVAGVTTVKNPIKLARAVMEHSEHVLLAGRGAEQFAKEQQLELVKNNYFDTEFRYQALQKALKALTKTPHQAQLRLSPAFPLEWNVGTVGAVAIDQQGMLAAATSTGGMTAKRYGRIGDAPLIGAGTFADNQSCAVSATGHGEFFIRYQVAGDICARVRYQGKSASVAADEVMQELKTVGGLGGVIVVDSKGGLSWHLNSEGMYRAKRQQGKAAEVAIFKD
ncbi:MAG: isoaspartyl peptidase/L-asparaginase [Rheinheimera sp.]|nr:MAG: isoaspartyl peptidase/L-asparaginase [Rheinheimera sp.]